jgi:hypothetical protein
VHHHQGGKQAEREVTVVLVQYASPLAAAMLPRQINSQSELQAASPAYETARLFRIVGVGIEALRAFALVLILAAGLSVFIALYTALEERRYDLAVMRTLGARRGWPAARRSAGARAARRGARPRPGHGLASALGAGCSRSSNIRCRASCSREGSGRFAVALGVGLAAALVPLAVSHRRRPHPVPRLTGLPAAQSANTLVRAVISSLRRLRFPAAASTSNRRRDHAFSAARRKDVVSRSRWRRSAGKARTATCRSSPRVSSLDQKQVKVQAHAALDMGDQQTLRPGACRRPRFCMPGGPESMVEVKTRTSVVPFDAAVVSGKLTVLKDDQRHLLPPHRGGAHK